ncbi:hypothetical protein pb186bvf_018435 [Paramecium bursaria]
MRQVLQIQNDLQILQSRNRKQNHELQGLFQKYGSSESLFMMVKQGFQLSEKFRWRYFFNLFSFLSDKDIANLRLLNRHFYNEMTDYIYGYYRNRLILERQDLEMQISQIAIPTVTQVVFEEKLKKSLYPVHQVFPNEEEQSLPAYFYFLIELGIFQKSKYIYPPMPKNIMWVGIKKLDPKLQEKLLREVDEWMERINQAHLIGFLKLIRRWLRFMNNPNYEELIEKYLLERRLKTTNHILGQMDLYAEKKKQ